MYSAIDPFRTIDAPVRRSGRADLIDNIQVTELIFDLIEDQFASFGIQHIGSKREQIVAEFFGSSVESRLVPTGDGNSCAFGHK